MIASKSQLLAVITARGGSKRIPRKNIRAFQGRPIIAYSIEAATAVGIFDEVMVSTDDDEIARIAAQYGAVVPFKRSSASSSDTAGTSEVLLEVLSEYRSRGRLFTHLCCLYPTAPFVTPEKLRAAWSQLQTESADAVVTVCAFSSPIRRSLQIDQRRRLSYNWPEYEDSRSQDLPPAYFDAGQLYFVDSAALERYGRIMMPATYGLIVPATEVQDIDTEEDWFLAELKYSLMTRGDHRPR